MSKKDEEKKAAEEAARLAEDEEKKAAEEAAARKAEEEAEAKGPNLIALDDIMRSGAMPEHKKDIPLGGVFRPTESEKEKLLRVGVAKSTSRRPSTDKELEDLRVKRILRNQKKEQDRLDSIDPKRRTR